MNRRELLMMIAAVSGVAMLGGRRAAAYAVTDTGTNIFTPEDVAFLDEVAETILPATATAGAKQAQVGLFMTVFVSDCYSADEQALFRDGMDRIKAEAQQQFGKPFLDLSAEERLGFLQSMDGVATEQARIVAEAEAAMEANLAQQPAAGTAADPTQQKIAEDLPKLHGFTPIKQLTMFGFFTSEIGATTVLRYEAVPGEYIGDLPYAGEPAWAT